MLLAEYGEDELGVPPEVQDSFLAMSKENLYFQSHIVLVFEQRCFVNVVCAYTCLD